MNVARFVAIFALVFGVAQAGMVNIDWTGARWQQNLSQGGGGAFTYNIDRDMNGAYEEQLTLFCVDSQLFAEANPYKAFEEYETAIGDSTYNVRYENHTTVSAANRYFRMSFNGSQVNPLDRFRAVAWLAAYGYEGVGLAAFQNTARNKAVQEAIWRIMDTADRTPQFDLLSVPSAVQDWIDDALAAVQTNTDWGWFRIYSGTAYTSGLNDYSGAYQTYVQIVPEPGFYGLLGLGLSGLYLIRRRKGERA
jgi:hypothetical protein